MNDTIIRIRNNSCLISDINNILEIEKLKIELLSNMLPPIIEFLTKYFGNSVKFGYGYIPYSNQFKIECIIKSNKDINDIDFYFHIIEKYYTFNVSPFLKDPSIITRDFKIKTMDEVINELEELFRYNRILTVNEKIIKEIIL